MRRTAYFGIKGLTGDQDCNESRPGAWTRPTKSYWICASRGPLHAPSLQTAFSFNFGSTPILDCSSVADTIAGENVAGQRLFQELLTNNLPRGSDEAHHGGQIPDECLKCSLAGHCPPLAKAGF